MKRMGYMMAAMFVGCGVMTCMAATPIRSYYATNTPPENPTVQGPWNLIGGLGGTAKTNSVVGDVGGYNAWIIEDDGSGGGFNDQLYYRIFDVASADRDEMLDVGFTYRWRLRIPNEVASPHYTRSIGAEMKLKNTSGSVHRRFNMQMGRNATDLFAWTWDGSQVQSGSVTVEDPDAYHMWTWFYHSTSGNDLTELYVDWHRILVYTNANPDTSGEDDEVVWGSRNKTGVATSHWNMVEIYKELLPSPQPPPPPGTVVTIR